MIFHQFSLCTLRMPRETVTELTGDKYFLTRENFTVKGNWIVVPFPPCNDGEAHIGKIAETLIFPTQRRKIAHNYD